jgi:hypothetical protein
MLNPSVTMQFLFFFLAMVVVCHGGLIGGGNKQMGGKKSIEMPPTPEVKDAAMVSGYSALKQHSPSSFSTKSAPNPRLIHFSTCSFPHSSAHPTSITLYTPAFTS